ncbi:hypothetical protein P154DRAFT_585859 [Amniculicola lignicola CBS 123094]|uniref:Uncharacterized protein n=1 Tax=Amniculicola lignicola CBS 123094 TaxID=1392246 RepID=A0A6A5VZD7_9PLEO|nr:hypothetical protein P154DRAFT_585859 [Amniculicola lignicola CBS 123094]
MDKGQPQEIGQESVTFQKTYRLGPVLHYLYTCRTVVRTLRKAIRPRLRAGLRRIEWTCECGDELFADFNSKDQAALDALEAQLHQSAVSTTTTPNPVSRSTTTLPASPPQQRHVTTTGTSPALGIGAQSSTTSAQGTTSTPRYLAICTSSGGIYKTLSELDISPLKSDSELFLAVADIYRKSSTAHSLWKLLLRPVSVEFIHLTVWDLHSAYISIFDRPQSIPPDSNPDYTFAPRTLAPLPPVPPELFIHYMRKHKHPRSSTHPPIWSPRLPARTAKRLIDCDVGTYGWGIYIAEGPNRLFVFWMVMLSVGCSILLSALWARLKGDVQGATGLGSLVLGVHSVVMAAFMFKFGELR